jgi:hypothetical protein
VHQGQVARRTLTVSERTPGQCHRLMLHLIHGALPTVIPISNRLQNFRIHNTGVVAVRQVVEGGG